MSVEAPSQPIESRFRQDFPFYARVCLRIVDKGARLVPLELNQPQRIVHQKLSEQLRKTGQIRGLILKARQEGISTMVAARNIRRTTLWPRRRAMVVADQDKRSQEIFAIYERMYDHLPLECKPSKKSGIRGQVLHFDRPDGLGLDSRLTVETARDVRAGRSATLHALHISELAFWDHPQETLASLMNAVTEQGGEVVIESTANGVGNTFHRMWEEAEQGNSDWLPIFLPWWIHDEYRVELDEEERHAVLDTADDFELGALYEGFEWEGRVHKLSPEQLAWRRRTIRDKLAGDERLFRQEYPSTAKEAFLVSGNTFFDEEALVSYDRHTKPPLSRGNLTLIQADVPGIVFRKSERGYLRVFELPSPEGHYVIGADTAEGKEVAAKVSDENERGGRDKSCADVVRVGYWKDTGETDERGNPIKELVPPAQVAHLHGGMAPEVFAQQLDMLGRYYSCKGREDQRTIRRPALLAPERNHSSGQFVLRELREKHRYPNLFYKRKLNVRLQKTTEILGWVTDQDSRPLMLDELSRAIREGTIGIPCEETLRECLTFVRNSAGRPEAQEGCHDDRVISLAISLQMALHHHTEEPKGEVPPTVVRHSLID